MYQTLFVCFDVMREEKVEERSWMIRRSKKEDKKERKR